MAGTSWATPNILAATTLGIGLSGIFSGANLALSYIAIPGLLLPPAQANLEQKTTARPATSPAQLARQWRVVYLLGKATLPFAALASCFCFLYVAWNLPTVPSPFAAAGGEKQKLKWAFYAAAGLAISIAPFTLIIMEKTNSALEGRASKADATTESDDLDNSEPGIKGNKKGTDVESTEDLMRWWAVLAFVRAGLPLAAIMTVVGGLVLYG
jgi:Domain of unknown function (DUF1772)